MYRKNATELIIIISVCSLLLLHSCSSQHEQKSDENLNRSLAETAGNRDNKMEWWREAKFGLFIHWGVYAVPGGVYKGKKVDRTGEWIMQYEHIPVMEYKEYAKEFNPVNYNPEQWVELAKEAGMKYLVITAKHHDGFALYDSKVTDWDIADASPYGKDLLKPLVNSCRENDIKVGFYYSHSVDYVHPGGEAQSLDFKPGGHWDPAQKGKSMDAYFDDIVVPQVKELLTNYGDIDILWWDGGGWYNVNNKRADKILSVTDNYPNLIMNNRLGGDYPSDLKTPEQYIPATGLDYDWETCMTMNDTWGYRSWDHNWKSANTLVFNLVDIVSKGGNYLLNIGPKADGTIPEASIERLKTIGRWMAVNGESIYGTTASPFENDSWGRCTKKDIGNGTTQLYLHIFNWPENGRLKIPRMKNTIIKASLLADKDRLSRPVTVDNEYLIIDVPNQAPDSICSVVRLDIAGQPIVFNPPEIDATSDIFYDEMNVMLKSDVPGVKIRYTLDGKEPDHNSFTFKEDASLKVNNNTKVKAALFIEEERVSEVRERHFTQKKPLSSIHPGNIKKGLKYKCYEGVWKNVPDFKKLQPTAEGLAYFFDLSKSTNNELFGMSFSGLIDVPETGVYRFHAFHNDGCIINIDEHQVLKSKNRVVDDAVKKESDGIPIVLEKGLHPITLDYFQRIDNAVLEVFWSGPGFKRQPVKAQVLFQQ